MVVLFSKEPFAVAFGKTQNTGGLLIVCGHILRFTMFCNINDLRSRSKLRENGYGKICIFYTVNTIKHDLGRSWVCVCGYVYVYVDTVTDQQIEYEFNYFRYLNFGPDINHRKPHMQLEYAYSICWSCCNLGIFALKIQNPIHLFTARGLGSEWKSSWAM